MSRTVAIGVQNFIIGLKILNNSTPKGSTIL